MKKDIYKNAINLAPFGFAYHQIILDDHNHPIDYRFLEVNKAFENMTGLQADKIVGNSILEVIPEIKNDPFDWISYYGEIALNGGEKVFEQFATAQKRWFKVHVYSPEKMFFITSFVDITSEKQNLEQLENFFAVNVDLLCITDMEGHFVKLNPSWEEILGYNSTELIGRKFFDFLHPDDVQKTNAALSDLNHNIKVLNFVNRYRCKDGTYRFLEWRSNTKNSMIYAAARDITQRILIEDELSNKNNLLSTFVKNSPIYCFIKEVTQTSSKVLYASDNFIDMVGISSDQMIGKTMEEMFPPDFAKKITADDWMVASKGDVLQLEEELNGKNYTTIKFPIKQQETTLLAGYTIDLTERKNIEKELRKQHSLLESLLRTLPIGVFMVEAPSGKPLVANEAAFELLGRGILPDVTAENLSQVYKAFKAGTDKPYPPAEMPILLGMKGKNHHIDDLVVEHPTGGRHQLEIFGTPVTDDQGNIWASLVSFFDITERKQLEQKLANYNEDLEVQVLKRTQELYETNLRLKEFAHVVSHDMKGPLRGISNLINFINEEASRLSAQQMEYFQLIQMRIVRLYKQVEAILEYSSIASQYEVFEVINPITFVHEVIASLTPPKTLRFEIQNLPEIYFSPQKLTQVFQNLIGNAIKFSKPDGLIKIWGEDCGKFIKISVQDWGIGIDPKYFDKIFQLFQTLHPKDEIEGSGVGLTIVKRIIEGHGGQVFVESALGQGAKFSFTILKKT